MSRQIDPKTIERYGRFLKVVKDSEGKELDLDKIARTFNLPKSAPAYAKRFGFINYKGKHIIKADYNLVNNQVEPIVARRLLERMNQIKRDNDAKRKAISVIPASLPDPETQKIVKQIKENAKVEAEHNREGFSIKEIVRLHEESRPKFFRVRVFGLPIIKVEPVYS